MTAPARPAEDTAGLQADIDSHRDHATELVAAYRDALSRLGDPVAAFACVVGSAYTVLCHRRTAQVLAAAAQMLEERRVELRDKGNDLLNIRGALSPSGYARRVPMAIGAQVAPVIEWVLDDRDRLRRERDEARACLAKIWQLLTWEDGGEEREEIPVDELVDVLKTGPDPTMDYSAAEEALLAEAGGQR